MRKTVLFSIFLLFAGLSENITAETCPHCHRSLDSLNRQRPSFHQFIEHINTPQANYIQIEDGSQWLINPRHQEKLQKWQPGDCIELLVNMPLFYESNYQYYFYNSNTKTSVEVNLVTAPIPYGPYTYSLHAFDKNKKRIILSDGSCWEIDPEDSAIFERWRAGDLVIMGRHIYIFSLYDYILINVNHNEFIPAERIY